MRQVCINLIFYARNLSEETNVCIAMNQQLPHRGKKFEKDQHNGKPCMMHVL